MVEGVVEEIMVLRIVVGALKGGGRAEGATRSVGRGGGVRGGMKSDVVPQDSFLAPG